MNLEVIGRHALFFDDDAMAAFVNSADALVEWHSLPIDRYDVRHLLSDPPPPRNKRKPMSSPPLYALAEPSESDIDCERYLDLPVSEDDEPDVRNDDERIDTGSYNTVGFSYGVQDSSTGSTDANAFLEGPGFRPSFAVPDHLLDKLPPTEKLHQIIARTALFVSRHGGQSEIVLRVKQGDNPTFGFLMPDHHLHAYFRYLVDHQELLASDPGPKNLGGERKGYNEHNQAVEVSTSSLSVLGSIYGSGEDEDGAFENGTKPEDSDPEKVVDDPEKVVHPDFSAKLHEKDKTTPSDSVPTSKGKPLASKKTRPVSTNKAGADGNLKKDGEAEALVAKVKSLSSNLPNIVKADSIILEPPSDLKKMVEKIVEFILQKGKEFEAAVVEQDTKYGRFPFLLPSNPYHPYYLKALEKAQESKKSGKTLISEKDDAMRRALDKINKKLALSTKEIEAMSARSDIPFESDKKEKFKMVITKPKKDGPDPPSKPPEPDCGLKVDATAAAAIIQAVRRGEKYPNLEIISTKDKNQEAGSDHKTDVKVESVANEVVESEFTKEQKLKAERLKRAKMFASMLKNGGAPKPEILRGLSAERPDSVPPMSGIDNFLSKQRERSSTPLDVEAGDNKPNEKYFEDEDENKERRSKRSYRPRSKIDDDDEDSDQPRSKRTSRSKSKHEDDEDTDGHDHRRSKRSERSKSKIDNDDGIDEDSDRYDQRRSKRSKQSRSQLHKDDASHDEKDGHDEHRSKRSRRSRSKLLDDDESHDEKDGRYEHRSKRSHQSRSKLDDGDGDVISDDDYHQHRSKKNFRSSSKIDNDGGDDDNEATDSSDEDKNHSKRKHHSRRSSHHSKETRHKRHRKRHSSSKHGSSSEDEHRHSRKHSKRSKSEKEADLEEGEIATKKADQSSKAGSAGDQSSKGIRASSQQPENAAEVPDELRAKIRAMLMANM